MRKTQSGDSTDGCTGGGSSCGKSRARAVESAATSKNPYPTFKNIEEEGDFWDPHSLTEFEDEIEEATDVYFVGGGPTKAMTVRLDRDTFAGLFRQAQELGVAPSSLARLWLSQRVHDEGIHAARKTSEVPLNTT
jgi:hypothetical protein